MLSRYNKVLSSVSPETKSSSCARAVFCLLLVFLSTQSLAIAAASDFRSGGSVVEQLAPASEKAFSVFLNRGESFLFSIEKGDLRIAVSVVDPSGHAVIEYPSHTFEAIEIALVADATGQFVLKIRSLETGSKSDQLTLTVQSVRSASAGDLKDSTASLVLAAAN